MRNQKRLFEVEDDASLCAYDAAFLSKDAADRLLEMLLNLGGWHQFKYTPKMLPTAVRDKLAGTLLPRVTMTYFDGKLKSPGDVGYGDSPANEISTPWALAPAELLDVRTALEGRFGHPFNICRLQRYDDERKHIGPHRDRESEGSWAYPIATISLGAERVFQVRECPHLFKCTCEPHHGKVVLEKALAHGSLFVMPPGFQKGHKHAVLKAKEPCGPRISLTFRYVDTSRSAS